MTLFCRIFAAAIFGLLSLQVGLAELPTKPSLDCTPNGNRFDLESLTDAALQSQYAENVAVIVGGGSNGDDLVVGGALDERFLNQEILYNGFYSPTYYVERANSVCAADFEGGLPLIEGVFIPFGAPVPAADAAHGAFFLGTISNNGFDTAVSLAKSTTATLQSPSSCPSGTQSSPATCWPIVSLANVTTSDVQNVALAVDQRISGTGAGDVYVAATTYLSDSTNSQITLSACTNLNLACSSAVVASGSDLNTQYASVQVQPGGGITIAYENVVVPFGEVQFKFVNCTPRGAPNPPTCSAPTLVIAEPNPVWGTPGAINAIFPQMPYHVDRLESNGNITSFLIYDQCAVAQIGDYFCPKAQIVLTFSTDGGSTWSPLQIVGPATGQQFLGSIALDVSTGTVNIAYFSSQNDVLQIQTQVFLAQVLPSQTSVQPPQQITTTLYDGPYGYLGGETDLSVAAGGTGNTGQSRVYIHFTDSVAQGVYNDQSFRIYHNTLTRFEY